MDHLTDLTGLMQHFDRPTKMEVLLERLQAKGFDASYLDEDNVRLGCSQCEATAINGTPCHEHGCPNINQECSGCNNRVPMGIHYCDDCY